MAPLLLAVSVATSIGAGQVVDQGPAAGYPRPFGLSAIRAARLEAVTTFGPAPPAVTERL